MYNISHEDNCVKTREINDQIGDDLKSRHINQCIYVFLMVKLMVISVCPIAICQMIRCLVKNRLESMWKKADVAQFAVISQHLQDLSFPHWCC